MEPGRDVVLTLAEVSPGVGVDHLASWVDRVVLLVATGRSSAERLRNHRRAGQVGGPAVDFAMMVGADRTDEQLGPVRPAGPRMDR